MILPYPLLPLGAHKTQATEVRVIEDLDTMGVILRLEPVVEKPHLPSVGLEPGTLN